MSISAEHKTGIQHSRQRQVWSKTDRASDLGTAIKQRHRASNDLKIGHVSPHIFKLFHPKFPGFSGESKIACIHQEPAVKASSAKAASMSSTLPCSQAAVHASGPSWASRVAF